MKLLIISSSIISTLSVLLYLLAAYYYCGKHSIKFDTNTTNSPIDSTTILGLICFFIPMVNLIFPLVIAESILSGELEEFVLEKYK